MTTILPACNNKVITKPRAIQVVGWGNFGQDPTKLAVSCLWWSGSAAANASMEFNKAYPWYAGESTSGCSGKWDFQGSAVHEFGHWWGLKDIADSTEQTMRKNRGGTCKTGDRTLGRGDVQGIKARY